MLIDNKARIETSITLFLSLVFFPVALVYVVRKQFLSKFEVAGLFIFLVGCFVLAVMENSYISSMLLVNILSVLVLVGYLPEVASLNFAIRISFRLILMILVALQPMLIYTQLSRTINPIHISLGKDILDVSLSPVFAKTILFILMFICIQMLIMNVTRAVNSK